MSWSHKREGAVPAAVRAQVIREAGGLCEICGQPGNQVDHIVHVARVGKTRGQELNSEALSLPSVHAHGFRR